MILTSGVTIPYGIDAGGELTNAAFETVYGGLAPLFLAVALGCFALATVLGWGLYGGRCAQFLFGSKAWRLFALVQAAAVVPGAMLDTGLVWQLAETVNGLMVIPNLIALAALTNELRRLTIEYKRKCEPYADFH